MRERRPWRQRLPGPVRRLVRPHLVGLRPRLAPLDGRWGYGRGTPIDRWYIENFLGIHRADIRGVGLEVKEDLYLRRFGTALTRVDIVDVDPTNEQATVVADLAVGDGLEDGAYDCFVLTQTLQYIADVDAAVRVVHRVLAPGGVVLATVPCITRVTVELPALVDYWRFTEASCRRLFEPVFGAESVSVATYGNLAAAAAFLAGYAVEELSPRERDASDARYPLVVCVRATRA